MPSPGRRSAIRRASSSGSPKCMKRPPLHVPTAVRVGSGMTRTLCSTPLLHGEVDDVPPLLRRLLVAELVVPTRGGAVVAGLETHVEGELPVPRAVRLEANRAASAVAERTEREAVLELLEAAVEAGAAHLRERDLHALHADGTRLAAVARASLELDGVGLEREAAVAQVRDRRQVVLAPLRCRLLRHGRRLHGR